MKTRYRSRLTGEFFKTEEAIIEHLGKEGIEDHFEAYYDVISLSEEDIQELEGKFKKFCEENPDDPSCKEYYGDISDTPEDTTEPIDIDSLSEEELLDRVRAKISVDQYLEGELSPTEEGMVLSRLLGQTQDKSVDRKAHDKVFEKKSTTRTAIPRAYQSVVERLTDDRCITCPLCHKEWSVIAEDLSLEPSDHRVKQTHLKSEHMNLWNVLKDLFGMSSEEIPDERVSTVPNPESCSDDEPEKLSKEELAERISSDEELRHQFFRKWMLKLQGKEK